MAAIKPFLEPVGVAALFAFAISVGNRLAALAITAWKEVALQRIATEQAMAAAVREQAATMAQHVTTSTELRREIEELGIVTRLISQRVGACPLVRPNSEQ